MGMELLEPVPVTDELTQHERTDEYWLPNHNNKASYLKLDFQGDKYTISWHTDISPEEFLTKTGQILLGTEGRGQVTALSDERDFTSGPFDLPFESFSSYPSHLRENLPTNPGIVKYELESERGSSLEVDWFNYPSSPHVSVTAEDFEYEDELNSIFAQTVDREQDQEPAIHDAYDEAVERARNRLIE